MTIVYYNNNIILSDFKTLGFNTVLLICFFPFSNVSMLSFMGHKSTFGISNFRTFSDCNYIDGCKIKNISSMVVPYRMGMLFNIVSYDDKITLNMTYRKRNLKFPKKFIKGLEDIYQDLLEKSKI